MVKSRSVVNETRGVSYEEYYSRGMVKSKYESADSQRGIPIPESHVMHTDDVRHYCEGVTKSGTACQARTVGDTYLCAGHTKGKVKADGLDGADSGSTATD
jgi:hypothetical protein